ncbi:uncharacterized protein BXZ73DRAFT_88460 [Epithele typhae]|uniref:uncharacterized protein n=1 Tax=Epithele typhae TaxID=378194 RepID=UPI00200866B6|nr:uncharacterized protein BXZ73DRAFT_88460 [Epithele typhae]KAH9941322.1 hypothetical protein BXZ73DRAFT_88460 [Epithele typhae]
MASVPNLPQPHSATRESSLARRDEPPLPASWLDSVTKAIVGSGQADARVGGPIARSSSRATNATTRPSRPSKLSVANSTPKAARGSSVLPPGASLYPSRPQTAPSTVNAAHVMCRSAPGSRSNSRAGDRVPGSVVGSLRHKDRQARGRRGSRGGHIDRVPSLASTRVEDDALANMYWVDGRRVSVIHHDDGAYDVFDSDDEDGELDLARLLVPAKRQYSILNDEPQRGRSHQVVIDDADGYPTFQRTESLKRRRGLPGGWGAAGSSRS